MDIDAVIKAFSAIGPARLGYDHQDGYYDIAVECPNGFTDYFHVYEEDGRLMWLDASHVTDLGPIDGSELVEKLKTWEAMVEALRQEAA